MYVIFLAPASSDVSVAENASPPLTSNHLDSGTSVSVEPVSSLSNPVKSEPNVPESNPSPNLISNSSPNPSSNPSPNSNSNSSPSPSLHPSQNFGANTKEAKPTEIDIQKSYPKPFGDSNLPEEFDLESRFFGPSQIKSRIVTPIKVVPLQHIQHIRPKPKKPQQIHAVVPKKVHPNQVYQPAAHNPQTHPNPQRHWHQAHQRPNGWQHGGQFHNPHQNFLHLRNARSISSSDDDQKLLPKLEDDLEVIKDVTANEALFKLFNQIGPIIEHNPELVPALTAEISLDDDLSSIIGSSSGQCNCSVR